MSNKDLPIAAFIRMASRPVPRVQRGMAVAKELGYEPVFCGALREDGLKRTDVWAGFPLVRIGKRFPLLNGKRFFLYFYSTAFFQLSLLQFLFSRRPKLVHASDIETMPGSMIYCLLMRTPLIYNVHDNLSQRYNLPEWVQGFLNTIEGAFILCSATTMVPEEFRKSALPSWCQHKISVVRNTPQNVAFSEPANASDRQLRLFYGGWLDWGRGLAKMVQLAEAIPNCQLVVAGEGSKEIVDFLKSSASIKYIGFIEHQQAIEETRKSHFVLAFYRPNTVINRYAASNKLAESLAVGRPLVLNSEMKITETLGENLSILSSPFDSIETLQQKILDLYNDEARYQEACNEARKLYNSNYDWDHVKGELTNVFSQFSPARGTL